MDDIFNFDFLDSNNPSDGLANSLRSGDDKVNKWRIDLFEGVYKNLLDSIKNIDKYLKNNYYLYSIPITFNGAIINKELKKCFMKHIIIRLNREKFKLKLINKCTLLITW